VFPVPKRYGGTLDDNIVEQNEKKEHSDNMMAFGFNVSQKDAEKKVLQNE